MKEMEFIYTFFHCFGLGMSRSQRWFNDLNSSGLIAVTAVAKGSSVSQPGRIHQSLELQRLANKLTLRGAFPSIFLLISVAFNSLNSNKIMNLLLNLIDRNQIIHRSIY